MSEPRQGLKSLGLENAVRLRWVLRDIKGNRLKLSPSHPNDLRILVDMGFVEIQTDVLVIISLGDVGHFAAADLVSGCVKSVSDHHH